MVGGGEMAWPADDGFVYMLDMELLHGRRASPGSCNIEWELGCVCVNTSIHTRIFFYNGWLLRYISLGWRWDL